MKILILNPLTIQVKNVVRDVVYGCWCSGKRIGGATLVPFNLLILTALLRRHSFEADFIDAQAEQLAPSRLKGIAGKYDAAVIATSTMSFQEDAGYLLELKRFNPRLKAIAFGSHPTFMPVYSLSHSGIDIIIKHEPEFVLRDLLILMREGKDYAGLKGIGFKKEGIPAVNGDYPYIEDLDAIPFPDAELLPKGFDYFNPIVRRMPYMATSTSRGCPGKCVFCTAPYFDGPALRFQSAGYVIREIEYFISKGIKEVYFRDDTFFVDRKRNIEIFDYIIRNKLDISWLANARVDLIDENTMRMAKEAGCHTIKFGVESGVQEILDRMRKGYRLEQARAVFSWADKLRLNTHAHIMLGNPGETAETIRETMKFALELKPTTASFGICTPYPGTPLFDMVKERFPEIEDGSASNLAKLHIEGIFNEHYTFLKREELRNYARSAYKKFYLRPGYWLQSIKTQIQGARDIKRVTVAAANVFDYIFTGRA